MIPCPACSYDNPLGTRFCRSCGGKLEVKVSQIVGSIEQTKNDLVDERVARAGRNALTLGLFLLICALVFRWVVVPKMPIADLPMVPGSGILPEQAPVPTSEMPVATLKRLQWRRDNANALIGGLGVDLVQIQAWQKSIIGTQQADGSFPGDEPLAATALAALALQAYPKDDATLAAAAKARAWLQGSAKDLTGKPTLGRTLTMIALLDAEELQPATFTTFSMYLVDGKAPMWQAFALPLFTAKDRPQSLNLLRSTLTAPLWGWYFDLVDGKSTAIDPKAFFSESAKAIATGEERMAWSFTAWHSAAAPKDLIETLSAWSRAAPAPIDKDTVAKCGATAPSAIAILTLAAPARVPPLWLGSKR